MEDDKALRSAREIIDQAIAENRLGERLCYAFSVTFVLLGAFGLTFGMLKGEGTVALAGSIPEALFVPAFIFARRIRSENIAIRLLEVPLNRAETAQGAAEALGVFFKTTLIRASETLAQPVLRE